MRRILIADNEPIRMMSRTEEDHKSMLDFANPTASTVVDRPSKVDRRVMCAGYGRCLDEAIRRTWDSFSCRKCHAFQPLKLNLGAWLADSVACVALIYVTEFQSSFKHKRRGGIVRGLRRVRSRDQVSGLNWSFSCKPCACGPTEARPAS